MNKTFIILIITLFLFSCKSNNLQDNNAKIDDDTKIDKNYICENVECFIEQEVANKNFTREFLDDFFRTVTYKEYIINLMNKPGPSNPWYVFKKNNANSSKIKNGIDFYKKNEKYLLEAANKYNIPPEFIVATIGIETNYGSYKGDINVADSLYTLAFFYPRRAEFFQNELREFLFILKSLNKDIKDYQGSYAGAMGIPQFMPSSYRKYAVSYQHDDFSDIWNNEVDVIFSIANYYHKQGSWKKNSKFMVEVMIDDENNNQIKNLMEQKFNLKYTIKELKKIGIKLLEDINEDKLAFLFRLEISPGEYKYYLGLENFRIIWTYNNSINYVCALYDIAQRIREGLN